MPARKGRLARKLPLFYLRLYTSPKSNNKIILEHTRDAAIIIMRSLEGWVGFDDNLEQICVTTHGKDVLAELHFDRKTKYSIKDIDNVLQNHYGVSAADTWMEGDISFPIGSDSYELHMDYIGTDPDNPVEPNKAAKLFLMLLRGDIDTVMEFREGVEKKPHAKQRLLLNRPRRQ